MSGRFDSGRPRSLPDHMTSAGDRERWRFVVEAVSPQGVVAHTLSVIITTSGQLGVAGSIGDEKLALSLLEHAIDAVHGYHDHKGGMTIPSKDVSLEGAPSHAVRVTGPCEDRMYAVACMRNAQDAIRNHHAKRAALTFSSNPVTSARRL